MVNEGGQGMKILLSTTQKYPYQLIGATSQYSTLESLKGGVVAGGLSVNSGPYTFARACMADAGFTDEDVTITQMASAGYAAAIQAGELQGAVSTNPWSAKKLTDAENGIYGFGAPNDTQSGYYNFVYQNGGFIFEDGKSGFDQEATQEAIQTWADLMLKDGVSPSLESFTDMGNDDQFQAGKVAMVFVGSWMMSAYTNNEFIKDKFDVAVLPQGKQRASIYNGLGYSGAYNTANPEIVKDFIAFCGSEQANILQAQNKAAIPAYKGTEHYFTDLFTNLNIACYTEMIEYGVQFPFSPNKSLWEGTETELMTSAYTGEMTFAEACNQLHETITEIEEE